MGGLVSRAVIADADPERLMHRLADRMRACDAEILGDGACRIVRQAYGTARIEVRSATLAIEAEALDPSSLAFVKGAIAFQVQDIIGPRRTGLTWTGDGCDGRLPQFREMRIVETALVTPRMRRIRLLGDDMERFATGGLHVRLLLPPKDRMPMWPHAGPAALPVWPGGEDRLTLRTYTIRRIDAAKGLVDIDVALHDRPGAGSDFALSAKPGDPVGLMGPGGASLGSAAWYLFVGDEAALPAIARMLEELPAAAEGVALIEVADADERQALAAPPGVEIRWLLRNGAPAGRSGLIETALATLCWPEHDDVFAFGGTEFRDFKTLRHLFRRDRGLKRDRHSAVAYWRRGVCEGDLGA